VTTLGAYAEVQPSRSLHAEPHEAESTLVAYLLQIEPVRAELFRVSLPIRGETRFQAPDRRGNQREDAEEEPHAKLLRRRSLELRLPEKIRLDHGPNDAVGAETFM
jgi:hypothetical protein